ncbi:hypothetical protein Dsin_015121 [Dipteronia sinensis]|uniref:PGG domain-containing protein n=1 Tax=Dipteronia sinensis TaxID=43782 RepID=A0AAE0EAJ0_9ROSI|nr:hypothetical protein Dsin_015121 [Dipteronia sinensis]
MATKNYFPYEYGRMLIISSPMDDLLLAVRRGDEEGVAKILQESPELALESGYGGNTALHLASDRGNLATVRLLTKSNPQLWLVKNIFGNTPLQMAFKRGRVDVIKEYLRAYPDSATDREERVAQLLLESIQERRKYGYLSENILHVAMKSSDEEFVKKIIQLCPELALESDHGGNTALHLASDQGNLAMVRLLVKSNPELCLVKNINERTPTHMAVMRDRVDVAFELLRACPESVTMVSATEETPLHAAIRQWQENVLELLIESIQKRSDYVHLINKKDCTGNTVLHLAIARKHFQVIRLLLSETPSCNGKVDVNAMNYGGFTALDILDVLPQEGKRDVEIEKILQREGAMRARDLGKVILDCSNNEKWIESQRNGDQSSHLQANWPMKIKHKTRRDEYHVLLITAALILAITFQAALNAPGGKVVDNIKYNSSSSLGFQVGKQSSNYLLRFFIWFDSIAFIASALMIIIITHEIPFKPWMLISVFSIYGAYICLIKVVSPQDALPVFLLGSPLILLASMSKHLALHTLYRFLLNQFAYWFYKLERDVSTGDAKTVERPVDSVANLDDLEASTSSLTKIVWNHIDEQQSNRFSKRFEYWGRKSTENPLLSAVKSDDQEMVAKIMEESPECALELNHEGNTALHLASYGGNLTIARLLIQRNPQLCLVKDRYGRTPLHTAAMKGRVDVIRELLSACPESIMEVSATNETTLHAAIRHRQEEVLELLLDCIKERNDYGDIINRRDCGGNTILHLAVSRKQLPIIKFLLADGCSACLAKVDVNSMNDGGFTAVDILDVLPQDGNRDMEIDKILRREGALRAKDLAKPMLECSNCETCIESRRTWNPLSNQQTIWPTKRKYKTSRDAVHTLLVTTAIFVTLTFHAALNAPGGRLVDNSKNKSSSFFPFQIGKQNWYGLRLFIWLDSIAFITSTASMIIILVNELPLKPWMLISVFSLCGAYICSIKAVSPQDALPLLLLGCPALLLAAIPKHLAPQSSLLKLF